MDHVNNLYCKENDQISRKRTDWESMCKSLAKSLKTKIDKSNFSINYNSK